MTGMLGRGTMGCWGGREGMLGSGGDVGKGGSDLIPLYPLPQLSGVQPAKVHGEAWH